MEALAGYRCCRGWTGRVSNNVGSVSKGSVSGREGVCARNVHFDDSTPTVQASDGPKANERVVVMVVVEARKQHRDRGGLRVLREDERTTGGGDQKGGFGVQATREQRGRRCMCGRRVSILNAATSLLLARNWRMLCGRGKHTQQEAMSGEE